MTSYIVVYVFSLVPIIVQRGTGLSAIKVTVFDVRVRDQDMGSISLFGLKPVAKYRQTSHMYLEDGLFPHADCSRGSTNEH